MADEMVEIRSIPDGYYVRDSEENWDIRKDVAGYEYPEEGYNYRIGVLREVIQTQDDIASLLDVLNAPFSETIKINMARAIVTGELLVHPPDRFKPLLATNLESIIALEDSGNAELADCYQVVFSRNHASRETTGEVFLKEVADAEQIFADAKMGSFHLASFDQVKEIYSFERLTAESDPKLLEDYGSLIEETFGYGLEELGDLLDDETILIGALAEQNGRMSVLGGAYAWQDISYLKRNGRDILLNTYEISGAVVRSDYRGKGLYKEIAVMLLELLAQLSEPVDIVFGYANLQAHAAIAVAAQTGKVLVTETARKLNLPIRPSMQLNRVNSKYVDDIVIYIPGEQLRRLYRHHKI
jgi:GNAT superfamily N-acetyltransferase